MSDFFDQLEQDLRRAGARRRSRRGRPALAVVVATVVALLAGASAAAAAYYVLRISPIAPFKAADSIPDQTVAPGTSVIAGVRAADPRAGVPAWTLRLSRSQTGLLCGTVGQSRQGRFGLVGLDGRFRRLPEANADACSEPDADGLALLGTRVFAGRRDAATRTVVYGAAGSGLQRVTLSARGRPAVTLRHDRRGAFLGVLAGYPEDVQPAVRLRWRSGRRRTVAFATSPFVVPDPGAGRAYAITSSVAGVPTGDPTPAFTTGCVQFRTARTDREDRGAGSPPVCGRQPTARRSYRDVLFFTTARLAGDRRSRASSAAGDWNDHPPRVATWGNALAARRIQVDAPGVRRTATPSVNGSFLIFLPAGTDPASARVTALLRDGTTRRYGPTHGTVPYPFAP